MVRDQKLRKTDVNWSMKVFIRKRHRVVKVSMFSPNKRHEVEYYSDEVEREM